MKLAIVIPEQLDPRLDRAVCVAREAAFEAAMAGVPLAESEITLARIEADARPMLEAWRRRAVTDGLQALSAEVLLLQRNLYSTPPQHPERVIRARITARTERLLREVTERFNQRFASLYRSEVNEVASRLTVWGRAVRAQVSAASLAEVA